MLIRRQGRLMMQDVFTRRTERFVRYQRMEMAKRNYSLLTIPYSLKIQLLKVALR